MSGSEDRRSGRPLRPRREPLFPLEAEDVAPAARPPQPLGELVGDLDGVFTPPPGEPARRAPAPPPRAPERPAPPPARPPRTEPPPPPRARPGHAPDRSPRMGALSELPRTEPPPRASGASPGAASPPRQRPTASSRSGTDYLLAETEALQQARMRYAEAEADRYRVEQFTAQPYRRSVPSVPVWIVPPQLIGIFVVSALILALFLLRDGNTNILSTWSTGPVAMVSGEAIPLSSNVGVALPPGDYTLKAPPSITPQQIDRILASYNSPANGTGAIWYNLGVQYGIDPAFAVAFFIHESGAGSARNWAGLKPDGSTTHNVGNIICAGYPTCFNRFRDYPSWEVGIADWYRLIDVEYIQGRGHRTVADVIPVYAPAFENDVNGYVNTVHRLVDQWRQGRIP